mgnify:CR=1 FL=1
MKSETFSFVLTEGTGDKRWGYCRMTIPGGYAKGPTDYPICFCVASLVPCFNIFSQILNQMEQQSESGKNSALPLKHFEVNFLYLRRVFRIL